MASPIILLANYADLTPGKSIGSAVVYSRMLLWSRGGEGRVCVNDESFHFRDGFFLFIPWGHKIKYYPTGKTCLRLAGIHLIPDLPDGEPVEFNIQHSAEYVSNQYPWRRDADVYGFQELVQGCWRSDEPLYMLSEYIVNWFVNGTRTEKAARRLAEQLIDELQAFFVESSHNKQALPKRLQEILNYIDGNFASALTTEQLAKVGECSSSTVQRLFQRHLGDRPISWIQKRRMEKAAVLLSSTLMPVGEVGQVVGIEDPYYFSRLFHQIKGCAAKEYRKKTSLYSIV